MKTIRYGSFETNSSSTHAIVIPKRVKEEDWDMGDSLDHKYDFGREECRLVDHWDEKLAYTYMILKDFEGWTDNNRKTKVTKDTIIEFKKWNKNGVVQKNYGKCRIDKKYLRQILCNLLYISVKNWRIACI